MNKSNEGKVFLVGAGPGDPDLLTVKALRILQSADVILYDKLVTPAIMALANPSAEKMYVGKIKGFHSLPQERINALLCVLAKQGKKVCRLKGGDPFMFGRGGEELTQLHAEGIAFEVVPGITAAAGCAAYSGIPLTHRDYNQTCTFLTGHLKTDELQHDWSALVKHNQTLVFYMGISNLNEITTKLAEHGLSASTPVALIENGTTVKQRVIITNLAKASQDVSDHQVASPALVIIGHVVSLRQQLNWFNPNAKTATNLPQDTQAGVIAA